MKFSTELDPEYSNDWFIGGMVIAGTEKKQHQKRIKQKNVRNVP